MKRNISCDDNLPKELLETDVEDYINLCLEMMPSWCRQVKMRRLWDSMSELRSSLRERRLERTVLNPVLLPVKTAQFTQFSVRYDVTQ